jgi:hypothetical protein
MTGLRSFVNRNFLAGFVASLALVAAFGAAQVASPPAAAPPMAPRYSFQGAGPAFYVLDNQTNTMYVYENQPGASVLRHTVDLNDVGKPRLVAKGANPLAGQESAR